MSVVYKRIRKCATGIAKKNVYARKVLRVLVNTYRRLKYDFLTRNVTVDEKTIAFNSFNGKFYSCTPRAIYEYMLQDERFSDYKFIWVVRDLEKYSYLCENANTTIVKNRTKEYAKALASAKYWIFNYRIYDYIYPKKEQNYVQCWHGTPLKRLGYDIEVSQNAMNSREEIRYKYRTDAEKFSYILSPSAFASEKFASAWNLNDTGQSEKIMEVGYPRNDFISNYKQEEVIKIKNELGIPLDKKVLLYAPTWRDNQHVSGVGYVYSNPVDFAKMQEILGSEWVILFRAHYLVANAFEFDKYEGFVYNASGHDDINELYIISDMLVTDYSSVFFDYAILKRPVLFYMYDLEEYANDVRGFYIDLTELPGPIVTTEEEFIDKVKNVNEWFAFDDRYRKFDQKFNYLNDGNACSRFVNYLFK